MEAGSLEELYAHAYRHHRSGQLADAERLYRLTLERNPDLADALHGLGMIAGATGRLREAVVLIGRAIALKPQAWEYRTNLGNAHFELGDLPAAMAAHRAAVELSPTAAAAHNNLARVLWHMGQREQAVESIRSAIALDPSQAESLTNLGNALRDLGQSDEALSAYRAAIRLRPDLAEAHQNLGNALALSGRVDEAISCYRRAVALAPESAALHSQLLTTLYYHPDCDPRTLLAEHRQWAARHAEPLRNSIAPHPIPRADKRPLRVGYLSGFFCEHVCARYLEPLLTHHDPAVVQIVCYSLVSQPDAITQRFRSLAHLWRDVPGLSDERLAQQIRADRIDILMDLHLHSGGNRLPVYARKPAPIQVSWLGYPGTTGLDMIDYRLTDPYLDPPGLNDEDYSEKSIRLETFWCYGPDGSEPPVNALPALQKGHVTFGCFNNFCKVNERTLNLWAGVLRAIPNSRLMLLADPGSHRDGALGTLQKAGIDPSRVEFHSRRPRRPYFELYHQVDIGLDAVPYNGHTTTLDALWMGVPVVSLRGTSAVSRGGLSILAHAGLPELVADSPQAFSAAASRLASDLPDLAELRSNLRGRMQSSPLTDAPRFARQMERAFAAMWERHSE